MNAERINEEHYAPLTELSAARSATTIIADLAAIAGVLALAISSRHPLVLAIVVVLVARQQHALAVLIHEGVHCNLFRSRLWNDITARWLLAGPLLVSYDGYRHTHLGHHRCTMTADDPDIIFVTGFPMTVAHLLKRLALSVTGISYAFLLLHYWRHGRRALGSTVAFLWSLLPPLLVNSTLLGVLVLGGHAWCYLAFWLVPMFFVFPLLLHIRGICEHAGLEPAVDPLQCTRTVINAVQTFFVAPHNINYHMEHHAYPSIPQFHLPTVHRILSEQCVLPKENIHRSYRTILDSLTLAR